MKTFPFFTNLFLVVTVVSCMTPRGPEQIHISFGHTPDKMYVMWSISQPSVTNVTYSPIPTTLELLAIPKCWQFTKGNPSGLQYLCRAELVSRRSWYCAIINCVGVHMYVYASFHRTWLLQELCTITTYIVSGAPVLP